MSLSVGIVENVTLEPRASEVNGQPVLNVVVTKQDEGDDLDFTKASMSSGDTDSLSITDWGLKTKGYEDGKLVDVRSPKAIMQDFKQKLAYRTALLVVNGVDIASIVWDPFADLEVNTDIIRENTKVLQDDVLLAAMTRNINNQTVQHYKEQGEAGKLLRVALIRTSAAKNTPKLRDKNLDKTPLAESMEVPAAESKVGFTKYEIEKGLNSDAPAPSDGDTSVNDTFPQQVKDPAGVPSGL